jgi:hypothetical protein
MRSLAIGLLLGLVACGGHTLGIGSNDGGASAAPPLDLDGALPSTWVLGTWRGPIDGVQFVSGDSTVTLTVTSSGAGGALSAKLLLGNLPVWPPPTDPYTTYPPGFAENDPTQVTFEYPDGYYSEGFEYTATPFGFDGIEVDFGIEMLEVWKTWCAMQKGVELTSPDGGVAYACMYGGMASMENDAGIACSVQPIQGGPAVPVDCGWLLLSGYPGLIEHFTAASGSRESVGEGNGVCRCTATSCTFDALYATDVPGSGQPDVTFSLRSAGQDGLEGTTSGKFGDHAVHLTRVE